MFKLKELVERYILLVKITYWIVVLLTTYFALSFYTFDSEWDVLVLGIHPMLIGISSRVYYDKYIGGHYSPIIRWCRSRFIRPAEPFIDRDVQFMYPNEVKVHSLDDIEEEMQRFTDIGDDGSGLTTEATVASLPTNHVGESVDIITDGTLELNNVTKDLSVIWSDIKHVVKDTIQLTKPCSKPRSYNPTEMRKNKGKLK